MLRSATPVDMTDDLGRAEAKRGLICQLTYIFSLEQRQSYPKPLTPAKPFGSQLTNDTMPKSRFPYFSRDVNIRQARADQGTQEANAIRGCN